ILSSLMTLRVFSSSPREYKRFVKMTAHEEKVRKRAWFFGNIQWASQGILMMILEIWTMYLVVGWVQDGTETIGTAVMVQAYIAYLCLYMWNLGQSLIRTRTGFADAFEMAQILNTVDDESIEEPLHMIEPLHNSIELNNISFSYAKSEKAIKNMDFFFASGRRYGLVGVSGSGKTTLTKLLLRLYKAEEGEIYVRGIDINK